MGRSLPSPPRRGGRLWRSYEELAASPDIRRRLADEFPAIADLAAVDRRTLMRLMGASLGLAGLAACDNDQPFGAPLLSHPVNTQGHIPSEPLFFATSLELGGYGRGALVRSHDGRPVKIEGNPLHPASLGATDPFMQAELLSIYDPDRSRWPIEDGARRSWSQLRRALTAEREALRATGGRGLHVVLGLAASPTIVRLVERLRTLYPAARTHLHAAIGETNASAGARLAFGRPVETVFAFDQADAILSLGHDFLGPGPAQVRYARDWIERRRAGLAEGRTPPLMVAEATPTLTGAKADRRIVLSPDDYESLARAVAEQLGIAAGGATHPLAPALAAELRRAGAGALVLAGREAAPAVHALVHAINERLGATGRTLRHIEPILPDDGFEPLAALTRAIAAGEVGHLVVVDGNPAYDAPADLDFAALAPRVPFSLHLGVYRDETARVCRWHVPKHHVLESWGDLRAFDGTAGLQQPATVPLLPGLSATELLSLLAGGRADGRALVRDTWAERLGSEAQWLAVLEAGVVPTAAASPATVAVRGGWDRSPPPQPRARFRILFQPDDGVWDGRFANNAWLQELPRPLTKLVWGNAALVAPAAAVELGVRNGDLIEISRGGRRIEAPVWIMPGQAADTITLPLGYGRPFAGEVGGRVGFDAYPLRTSAAPWLANDARVRPLGRRVELVSTQAHHDMTDRDIVRTVASDRLDQPIDPPRDHASFYPEHAYPEHAWGMVIDLDACIGCNACTIACQAENNIPVVGPEEVARGREMHWIRVDRYYDGAPADPETSFMPVPCMHCEKAPCEVVCPVNATVHSSDGLNQMVYNRCIGTRTCSNNCPYKVRRFNWFDYSGGEQDVPRTVKNPRVTVRDRGVMEKCTYCVQRINAARIAADIADRPIAEGELQTACQQVCPTRAIVFGDLNDPGSAVARLAANPRNYALLGELNTQPRTTYLAKVMPRDPEPDDAASG